MIKFAVKSALLGSAVYYTVDKGVWKDSTTTSELYEELEKGMSPYVGELKKQIPYEVSDSSISQEGTYLHCGQSLLVIYSRLRAEARALSDNKPSMDKQLQWLHSYEFENKGQLPPLPSNDRLTYLFKYYWNSGVKATFRFLVNLPTHASNAALKTYNFVSDSLEPIQSSPEISQDNTK